MASPKPFRVQILLVAALMFREPLLGGPPQPSLR